MKKVLIVGAGFGGLSVAKKLGNQKGLSVVVIDRRNYHLFQPLLYQVAMAGLSPAEIAAPIRSLLSSYRNIDVLMAEVSNVDLKAQSIRVEDRSIHYDYLIIACGAKQTYFGHDEWKYDAPSLKTVEQATEIRRRVLYAFERAEADPSERKAYLTFAVIGGGPTGVELAGALGEISRYTLSKDFRHIDPKRTRIILIEAGPRILPSFSQALAQKASQALEKLGVQVWTDSLVTNITEQGISLGSEFLAAKTVIWAAGVCGADFNSKLDVERDKQNRIIVDEFLTISQYPRVFVIGDQCHFKDKDGTVLPGLASVAMQQGKHVGDLIISDRNKKKRKPFRYLNKGQLATIGRKSAILEFKKLEMNGFFAWIIWLFVHIYYLIGFKNRVFVLIQWAWYYCSYARGARLIIDGRSSCKKKES